MNLRSDVMKALEELRNNKEIKSNMEAKVVLSLKDDYKDLLDLEDQFNTLFITAKVELTDNHEGLTEYESAYLKAEKFDGDQCPRCWNRFDHGTLNSDGLCPRCSAAVKKITVK